MSLFKFEEVLNELIYYFILGDPYTLLTYQQEHHLSSDLITVFTTTNYGEKAVKEGVLIALAGIENHPYTVYFTLEGTSPILMQAENNIKIYQDGYCLKVISGHIYLYTMRPLSDYNEEKIQVIKKYRTACIELPAGWYRVAVLAGLTYDGNDMVPTFEFIITPSIEQPPYNGDISRQFTLTDEYVAGKENKSE